MSYADASFCCIRPDLRLMLGWVALSNDAVIGRANSLPYASPRRR